MKKPALVALVIGLVLAAVLTYPTIVHPASMTRFDSDDGKFSVWNVAWVAHSLVDDPANLFNANIFYPAKGTLAYSEANLVAGAIGAPVYALTRNPITTHNLVVYLSLVLAFFAMWALVRRLTGDWVAALVAATGFAFAPYVAGHTPEIQLLMVFVFPVVMLALHRFLEASSPARAVALGLALAVAGLASGYYGIFAGLSVGLGVILFARGQARSARYWLGVVLALAVTGAVVGPPLRPYLALRQHPGARGTLDLSEAAAWSAHPAEYLRSASYVHRAILPDLLGKDGKEVLFPGCVVTVLGVAGAVGAFRRRKTTPVKTTRVVVFYSAVTLFALWASLGPDYGLYKWLAETTPFMSFLRAPSRLGILVVFGLAVLAGFSVAALRNAPGRAWLAPVLVVVIAAEVFVIWPLRVVPPVADVYRTLASLPRGGVLELHFPYKRGDLFHHAPYMFWSMYHWQPLINGYSDFIPEDFAKLTDPATGINGFPNEPAMTLARRHDVRYVVVHWETYNDPRARDEMVARFAAHESELRAIQKTEKDWLFEMR